MWDAAAQTMAINVIAKVESGGAYDAIHARYFTLGIMQWYGPRARDLLKRIEVEHPAVYVDLIASVKDDVANETANSFWNTRSHTGAERSSLKVLLREARSTQGAQANDDVNDYKAAAQRVGIDLDVNTQTAIFFCVMYHLKPSRAINIINRVSPSSTMKRVFDACMNDSDFGRYTSRWRDAYEIISSDDPPVLVDLNDDDLDLGDADDLDNDRIDGNGQESLFDPLATGAVRVESFGSNLYIYEADGRVKTAVPTGGSNWLVTSVQQGTEVDPPTPGAGETDPVPDPSPDPPTGDEAEDTRNKLVKFMTDRVGKYAYSQGPSRLTPDSRNMTDCSGLTRYAYLTVTGIDIGTYTDAQLSSKTTRLIQSGGGGNSPNPATMKKGDLVISRRYGTAANRSASHVEIYMGGGQIIGHGGPMNGPIVKDLAARTADKQRWWVKRLNSL